jgi:hypothetical protein
LTESIPDTSPEVAIADPSGHVYSGLVGGQKLDRFARK